MRRNRSKGRERPGHHLMICDLSGWKMWDDEAMQTWDGLWVHRKFYEERHPQDFVRGTLDDESVYPIRNEGEDSLVREIGTYCTASGRGGECGYGVAGCSINGLRIIR